MLCKNCIKECIGETPCTSCKESIDVVAICENVVIFSIAAIVLYWIGVVV